MKDRDIQFFQKQTGLGREKILLLCEQERDCDLILEQIIKKKLTKKDLNGLSFKLYAKIVIFTATSETDLELSEKSLVSNIVGELFPKLNNRTHFGPFIKKITQEPNVPGSKYFFVISSLFGDKVNCKDTEADQIKYISAGLSHIHPTFSKNIGKWFGILKSLKTAGKFRVNVMEEKFPEIQSCPRISPEARNLINGPKK